MPRIDKDIINAAKGILILLLVFGHASNVWTPEPFASFSIKFFHVACFLLLPFIYEIKPLTWQYARDRAARYYIPFAIFTILYAALYSVTITHTISLSALLKALIIGNAAQLDIATGLRALWFIPTYITILALTHLIPRIRTQILLPIALAGHCAAILLANTETLKHWLPFGFVNALYLFPIGLILHIMHLKYDLFKRHAPAFLFLTIAGITAAYLEKSSIKFPIIHLPDFTPLIALHPIIIIAAFMFLTTTDWFKKIGSLKWIGQNSLIIYITHLPFMAACNMIAQKFIDPAQINTASSIAVFATFAISLSGGIACAMIINRWEILRSLIAPKNWQDWLPVKGLKK
jgi:fucose 4-O-acetylase-like acetyltransferase